MADANYGILQPLESAAPIRTSMGSAPSAPTPQANPGVQNMTAMQELALKQQQAGLLQQENTRANQLQPGLLQQQANANRAAIDTHQEAQSKVAAAQYAIKIRDEAAKAYTEGEARGGVKGGFDSVSQRMAQLGDVDGAMKLATSSQDLQSKIAKGDIDSLTRVGSAIHGVMSSVVPPNPQTGDPGKTALQAYAQQYPQIKRLDANAPAPSSFKDDQQFQDTYVHPVLATALPYQKLEAQKAEMLKGNALAQANSLVQDAQDKFQQSLKKNGPQSKETLQAASELSNAQNAAKRAAVGGGLMAGLESHLPVALGGLESPEGIIKKNSPSTIPSTTAPAFSAADIQAELARRSGQK